MQAMALIKTAASGHYAKRKKEPILEADENDEGMNRVRCSLESL